jgi:hypothetical protein
MLFEHTTNWNTDLGGFGEAINWVWGDFMSGSCHTNYHPTDYNNTNDANMARTARNFLCP